MLGYFLVFLVLFFLMVTALSFMVAADWWRRLNLETVITQEKFFRKIPVLGWLMRQQIKWLQRTWHNWFIRLFGLLMLLFLSIFIYAIVKTIFQ